MGSTHYDVLEVSPRATVEVIEAAYRALMKRHHPDVKATAGRTAMRLIEAKDVLTDPTRRAAYDAEIAAGDTGVVIGGFRVDKALAEGGFGKTYLGTHILTGQPVCIKHCSNISAADEAILVEEAQAMWDLRHFAIPAIRNLVRLEDRSLALVMSYIPGPTLAEVVEHYISVRQKLDPEDVAWIAQRVLNALSYIHRHGVVHGDLKPQNIIIQPGSHMVALVDFGLAAIRPTRSTGSKGFTEVFSPPEQVAGSPLIPQTDFYALGMSMIYALTGGDEARIRAREVPSTVPEPLSRFIQRLVVRSPLARPDWSTEDLNQTIERVRAESFGRTRSAMKPLSLPEKWR